MQSGAVTIQTATSCCLLKDRMCVSALHSYFNQTSLFRIDMIEVENSSWILSELDHWLPAEIKLI